jgi:hypothetical protein
MRWTLRHDPRRDPVPDGERPRGAAFADEHGIAAANEVLGEERLAGDDIAYLVKAHRRDL